MIVRLCHQSCWPVTLAAVGLFAFSAAAQDRKADPVGAEFRFPTVPLGQTHTRELLANALRYVDPANKLCDPASGYPFEGWNQEPDRQLYLRSFTQLTAIGMWMETLATLAAGEAEVPFLTADQALDRLTLLVKTLRQDQRDPELSAGGLLGNFLDLESGRRRGPLTDGADKAKFVAEFGQEKGEAIWKALVEKGWLAPTGKGDEAAVRRAGKYGADCFDGPLKGYGDDDTKKKVMALLDRRTVLVVFGDNANLSASAAKVIGALLLPRTKDRPEAAAVRRELEAFLDAQKDGYTHLYDPKVGLFYFGWDAQKNRYMGWQDKEGKWITGHMDYLVNEFRGPTTFVCLRNDLPPTAVQNLGFKMKPYTMSDGRGVFVLAPWEGSAFQALGLEVAMDELASPAWRTLLKTAVDVEIDFAKRHKLPGFLSECYTGSGIEYTGRVGIPDITVSTKPRITDVASLYSLGPAHTIAPDEVEKFLAGNWRIISKLLTDHGPWEGFNTTRNEPVQFETTAHTLALAVGLLGNASENMKRYLDSHGLGARLEEMYRSGPAADLLAGDVKVFAWAANDRPLQSARGKEGFRVEGDRVGEVGMAFVPTGKAGVNLSGGELTLRYKSAGKAIPAVIALKSHKIMPTGVIPTEIFTHLVDTNGGEAEIRVPLPATPGLNAVREVVITLRGEAARSIDLTITRAGFAPTPGGH